MAHTNPFADAVPRSDPAPRAPRVIISERFFKVELPGNPWCDNLVYVGRDVTNSWQVRPHYHDNYELGYVDEGSCHFACNNIIYQVAKGDLYLIRPGEVHWGVIADRPFQRYYAGYNLNRLVSLEPLHYSISECHVVRPETPVIGQLLHEIIHEVQEGGPGFGYMISGLFIPLIVSALRCFPADQQRARNIQSTSLTPLVQRSIELLHSDMAYGLEDLSAILHVSKTHLAREFRRQIGLSVGKYAHSLRMDRARHMLRDTADNIGEIAGKLGFASIQSFSGAYKKATGQSPLEFRRQLLSGLPQ